ncbi:MAG: SIS domain-containing protein [Clostridia bacterium]|nr:SIS domain-containing protein [Clostridia bacterium]
MITEKYYGEIIDVLKKIKDTQKEKIASAADMISEVIVNDGIIYVFGCGHSHLIALDTFYRAGGLANVSAMLDTDLMLHNGAAKSSKMEKMSGIASSIFERYDIKANDAIIVVSTSGKNAVPVEMALEARKNNIKTISIVSSAYFEDKKAEPMLYQCSDIFVDNCVVHGDATLDIAGANTKMGSISTIASSFVIQSILMEGAALAAKSHALPPIYMSGNIDGGEEYNKELIRRYLPRIKHL